MKALLFAAALALAGCTTTQHPCERADVFIEQAEQAIAAVKAACGTVVVPE